MSDRMAELGRLGFAHYLFTDESAADCVRILAAYEAGERLPIPGRRL